MNEWVACIDAITFIFQARTTPINNEKKGIKTKNKREQEIYTCTLLAFIIAQENL